MNKISFQSKCLARGVNKFDFATQYLDILEFFRIFRVFQNFQQIFNFVGCLEN